MSKSYGLPSNNFIDDRSIFDSSMQDNLFNIFLNTPKAGSIEPLTTFDDVGHTGKLSKSFIGTVYVDNIWYYLINVRHRNGRYDGFSYGMQIRLSISTDNRSLQYRWQTAGTWSNWKNISST